MIGKRGSSATLDYTSHGINLFQQGSVYRIAVPMRVHETPSPLVTAPQTFYQPTYQGLHRFEIDSTAKTMVSKTVVKSIDYAPTDPYPNSDGLFGIANDRSLQIGSVVHYFSGGRFVTANW